MLRVYEVILAVVRGLREPMVRVEKCDGDLARQMRRAAASVALNSSEGMGSFGGNRRLRYRTALGSMRETKACLDVAIAFGYVEQIDGALLRDIDRVIGTLYNLSK